MKDLNLAFKGAIGGLLSFFCGLNWELIIIWSLLAGIDIVTGILKAMKKGEFYSAGMNGLYRKAGECFLLLALVLGQRVAMQTGINVPVAPIFIGAFCLKELGSIIENSLGMDIKIPPVITKWFRIANVAINQYEEEDHKKAGA